MGNKYRINQPKARRRTIYKSGMLNLKVLGSLLSTFMLEVVNSNGFSIICRRILKA
jgi:hypothetical protein